ncbi:H/ACA ribonucleoprotein complex non-core subunit NAF1 [Colletotrichum tropicale]|nr:H/ACA ribonucleoprotein complex non-core subunit NAF1 [Colletotrichum tropicale]
MSGFQIPGLGFAKPNETLPPLPPDVLAAAASFEGANIEENNKPAETKTEQNEDTKMEETPAEATQPITSEPQLPPHAERLETNDSEAMNIDAAEPPSLTDALEAMINGLDTTPAVQPAPTTTTSTEQPATTTTSAEQEPAAAPEGQEAEHPEWEIDSSPYESSSESSSSSSSSDDDSESGEGYQLLGVEETARMLMEMEGGSDDEGGPDAAGKAGGAAHLRTKNEVAPDAVPKPDLTLTADDKIEALGAVDQVVDNIMVVRAFTPGEYQVLDSGSALCTEDRKVFGAVWETIGKVLQPMYTVMFGSAEEIKEAGLEVGTKVYYPVAHATFVFTEPLKNLKGSDASNIHDEEVAEDEMEFSDDEKEAEHKRQAKQKKKDARARNGGGERPARGGGAREPHPLRNEVSAGPSDGGLNYDDEDDGPYKPLTRPPGFGQVPPMQQTFSQEPEPGRFGGRRGGRGDFRGRGDRGRGRGRGGRGGFGQREGRDGYSMPQQRHQEQQSQGQWGSNNNNYQQPQQPQQQSAPAPAAPTFNFPFPGMPPQPGGQGFPAVPPPPPGWPAQGGQTGQNPAAGAYINPAFFAALLGQMQQNQAQNGQQAQQQPQQNQQQPPQQPPHQWGAQPPPR